MSFPHAEMWKTQSASIFSLPVDGEGTGGDMMDNVMTDREIALDIGEKWLNVEAKVTALETLLAEHLPDRENLLRKISVPAGLTPQQHLVLLQHAFDEDKSDDSVIRILHQVLFES
jgi:hypothetical protein